MAAMEEQSGPRPEGGTAGTRPEWAAPLSSRAETEAGRRRWLKSQAGRAFPPRPTGDEPSRVIDLEGHRNAEGEALHGDALALLAGARDSLAGVFELGEQTTGLGIRPGLYVESMNEAARLANSAQAAMVLHAVRLAAHPRFHFEDAYGHLNSAPEEIGMSLAVPAPTAGRWLAAGRDLFGRLSATGALFTRGDLTLGKALAVAESLRRAGDALAWEVEERILPHLAEWTIAEIERRIAGLLIELDPDLADERHARARRDRHVTRLSVLPDGMASLKVRLPADCAATVDTALSQAAATARAHGDARNRQQVRADTLTSWAVGALANGADLVLAGADGLPTGDVVSIPPTTVNLTIPLEVAARTIPGWNPHPSPLERTHQDLYGEEYLPLPGSAPESKHPDPDPERADLGSAFCAGDPRDAGDPESSTENHADGRTEAAWLEGYGPIAPSIAILMSAGGDWRRILTDTATGVPLDVGRTMYEPPLAIRIAARLRDRVCARPGCGAAAHIADLDHVQEWNQGGTTSLDNMAVLCRRCHRIKTLGGGHLRKSDTTGQWEWRSTLATLQERTAERSARTTIHARFEYLTRAEAEAAERAARSCGVTIPTGALAALQGGEQDPRTSRPTPWRVQEWRPTNRVTRAEIPALRNRRRWRPGLRFVAPRLDTQETGRRSGTSPTANSRRANSRRANSRRANSRRAGAHLADTRRTSTRLNGSGEARSAPAVTSRARAPHAGARQPSSRPRAGIQRAAEPPRQTPRPPRRHHRPQARQLPLDRDAGQRPVIRMRH
nr:DUF222 domain-containing protein [Actinomycetales bacterium]